MKEKDSDTAVAISNDFIHRNSNHSSKILSKFYNSFPEETALVYN